MTEQIRSQLSAFCQQKVILILGCGLSLIKINIYYLALRFFPRRKIQFGEVFKADYFCTAWAVLETGTKRIWERKTRMRRNKRC